MTDDQALGFATRAIHQGDDPLDHAGALNPPVYLNSTYAFPDIAEGQRRFRGESPGYLYSRVGNPTVSVLEARLGVTVRFADLTRPEELTAALDARTRVVFCESPANPNMRLIDIAAISAIARRHGALTIVDNTYCTPYLQRPLALGADLVVHSATKYLGGHGDLLAGAAVGSSQQIQQIRFFGIKEMTGAGICALDAYLVLRGLKTLELRMERHCESAQTLAELLAAHPAVAAVSYPGLASFPQGELARRQMRRPGGMIAQELRDTANNAGVRCLR